MPESVWSWPGWDLVGFVVGVLGILVGAWLAWWFARGSGMSAQVSGTTLVTAPDNERICVHYDGKQVPRVTRSVVWMWRTGRGTVKGTDVVSGAPLVLTVPDGDVVLGAGVLRQSVSTNMVTLEFDAAAPAPRTLKVTFDYLDQRQGAAFEVFHTSLSPEAVSLSGTIMGIPRGIRRTTPGSTMPVTGVWGTVVVTLPNRVPRHLRAAVVTDPTERQNQSLADVVGRAVADALKRLLP